MVPKPAGKGGDEFGDTGPQAGLVERFIGVHRRARMRGLSRIVPGKSSCVCEQGADAAPVGGDVEPAERRAIDQDLACFQRMQAEQDIGDGGLAAASDAPNRPTILLRAGESVPPAISSTPLMAMRGLLEA